MRRDCRNIKIGNKSIGPENRIMVQSMLSVPSYDTKKNISQAIALENAGCDIIRVAIPDINAIELIYRIKENISIPLVADIHFDYRLAIEAVNAGIDKIRINPGNIGSTDRIKEIVKACKNKNIPIRIGVNSGSLEKDILEKYGNPTPEALCESALHNISILEKFDFEDIVISIKSSDVRTMVKSYELIALKSKYPLHLGVTEAGTERMGTIKSSIGIGSLLLKGIGDTIRVSLTADPIKEVSLGFDILKSINLYNKGISVISCPTCGRTKIDLIKLVNEAEERLKDCEKNIKVAIMGCAVNGPGEAKEADIGIAGGDSVGLIFKKGKIIKKVPESDLINELVKEIKKM